MVAEGLDRERGERDGAQSLRGLGLGERKALILRATERAAYVQRAALAGQVGPAEAGQIAQPA